MFFWLVVASAVTGLGVIFEAPGELHELKRWWKLKRLKKAIGLKVPITFLGLVLVIGGIIGEGIFEFLSSDAETSIRAYDEKILGETIVQAGSAKESADAAKKDAELARGASSDAVLKAGNASIASAKALGEADSLESDIVSAKKQAADAVSRLADAEQRLAESTQREVADEVKLNNIKTPRSLINAKGLIATLKPLKGTEYTLNVFQDDESIQFTKSVDEVLREAGLIRRQKGTFRLGVPSFNIFKDDTPNHDESVPVCVETGIQIHVRSTKTLQSLLATPAGDLPIGIRNAAALRGALQGSIEPAEERNVGDRVILDEANPGDGPMVICVGKKP
jgi:hypothetical protein